MNNGKKEIVFSNRENTHGKSDAIIGAGINSENVEKIAKLIIQKAN